MFEENRHSPSSITAEYHGESISWWPYNFRHHNQSPRNSKVLNSPFKNWHYSKSYLMTQLVPRCKHIPSRL